MSSKHIDTKQQRDRTERARLRCWLRAYTHWRNLDEFFTAVLFECGPPPYPISDRHLYYRGVETPEFNRWRDLVADVMNDRLHHRVDPSHTMREYFKWLSTQQDKNRISRL